MDLDEIQAKRQRLLDELGSLDEQIKKRDEIIAAIRLYDVTFVFEEIFFQRRLGSFEYKGDSWVAVFGTTIIRGTRVIIYIAPYGYREVEFTNVKDGKALHIEFKNYSTTLTCVPSGAPGFDFIFEAAHFLSDSPGMIAKVYDTFKTIYTTDRPIRRKCILLILAKWRESKLGRANTDVVLLICKKVMEDNHHDSSI
jgi:hypothetical protein